MVAYTFNLSIQEEVSLVYRVTMGTQQNLVSEKKKCQKEKGGAMPSEEYISLTSLPSPGDRHISTHARLFFSNWLETFLGLVAPS